MPIHFATPSCARYWLRRHGTYVWSRGYCDSFLILASASRCTTNVWPCIRMFQFHRIALCKKVDILHCGKTMTQTYMRRPTILRRLLSDQSTHSYMPLTSYLLQMAPDRRLQYPSSTVAMFAERPWYPSTAGRPLAVRTICDDLVVLTDIEHLPNASYLNRTPQEFNEIGIYDHHYSQLSATGHGFSAVCYQLSSNIECLTAA